MKFPIISGISTAGMDFRTAYPVNLVPVPKVQGISEGYLRPSPGIETVAVGIGRDRGGYLFQGAHYRVQGTNLVRVDEDGTLTNLGFIAGSDFCSFAESFDYLAINGGGRIWLYDGATLAEITDIDLGLSLDVTWINGYFISTDGESLVVTDLGDPFSVNPLKYASSEIAPDPVVAVRDVRNEIYAVNRYTTEVFAAKLNPGSTFPFARVEGAQVMKGALGGRCCCEFSEALAILGGGRNEAPAIWIIGRGSASKLSSREVDQQLRNYTEEQLSEAVMESISDLGHDFLYLHLPDRTLVFDAAASAAVAQPVWFTLRSGVPSAGYRARGFVRAHDAWFCGDPFYSFIGRLSDTTGLHYGDVSEWEFSTPIVYNEGRGAIVHELELVTLNAMTEVDESPLIYTQSSLDGQVWSVARASQPGRRGARDRRLIWRKQGQFPHWRIQRFKGDTRARYSFARLEAQVEALNA